MYSRIFCPKQGQGFKPSAAYLYPNINQVALELLNRGRLCTNPCIMEVSTQDPYNPQAWCLLVRYWTRHSHSIPYSKTQTFPKKFTIYTSPIIPPSFFHPYAYPMGIFLIDSIKDSSDGLRNKNKQLSRPPRNTPVLQTYANTKALLECC